MGNKHWTNTDYEYLSENWGVLSLPTICKNMNRSEAAILIKVSRLNLGSFLDSGEYVTLNQLIIAVTGSKASYGYKMKSWVENRGLPVHNKLVNKDRFRVVYIDEFWEWAEKNRSFIDFSKMEPLILGAEPNWVAAQRKKDFQTFAIQRKDPWTGSEDKRLTDLLKQYRYGYAELAKMLCRSAGAIQRRCVDLGIKERPVKAAVHNEWTADDLEILADGIRNGDSYSLISRALGRSDKAVRGKVYFTYFTENADKVRKMLGDGTYGSGAPMPAVRQAVLLSSFKKETCAELSKLATLLIYRRNELGWNAFWQKDMCQNWDEIKGCTANETDCDTCTSFQRIAPQYCRRCGATVISRNVIPNRLCDRCRQQRKKQAQKKYQCLYGSSKNEAQNLQNGACP